MFVLTLNKNVRSKMFRIDVHLDVEPQGISSSNMKPVKCVRWASSQVGMEPLILFL